MFHHGKKKKKKKNHKEQVKSFYFYFYKSDFLLLNAKLVFLFLQDNFMSHIPLILLEKIAVAYGFVCV